MKHAETHRSISLFFLVLALFPALSAPVLADVLVMQDGSKLTIDGAWRERGRVIEFTLPNGTLGSVRASEVDLDASRTATEAAAKAAEAAAAEPEEKPKPEPIAVWTDKDIPKASPEVLAGAATSVDAQSVQVTEWQVAKDEARGLVAVITGTVQNFGGNSVSDLSLAVTVSGDRVTGPSPSLVRQARLDRTALDPGETTTFEVQLRSSDISSVGTLEEFEDPDATFEIAFTGDTAEDGESAAEEDSDEG